MGMAATPADLQAFRAVFVNPMGIISATLALTVTGGVRQGAGPITLGTASCSAILAV